MTSSTVIQTPRLLHPIARQTFPVWLLVDSNGPYQVACSALSFYSRDKPETDQPARRGSDGEASTPSFYTHAPSRLLKECCLECPAGTNPQTDTTQYRRRRRHAQTRCCVINDRINTPRLPGDDRVPTQACAISIARMLLYK